MKMILVMILCLFLVGCATLDPTYYTRSNSPGYTQQVLGGLCEVCNRTFLFSQQQYNTIENIQCPYDGHVQNLKMASNRYVYLQQQQEQERQRQQALSNQIAVNNFFQSYQRNLEESNQNKQQIIRDYQNNIQNWRQRSPVYQYTPPVTIPTYQQDTYWTPFGDGTGLQSSEGETCVQLLNGGWKCSK